jgi:uncharacterized protein
MSTHHKTANKPENLRSLQTRFAAHIRDPENHAAPADVDDRRLEIYRQLFFNNINKFLASNFPVLRQLYDDEAWRQLARDFYTEHRCHTPLFPELPKEFLRYLQDQRKDRPGDPAFLLELAHYEWVELALSMDENELEDTVANSTGDLMEEVPVLSPLAWPLSYRFPVHQIRPGFEPEAPPEQATHILVYRNRNDKVKFMQLNDVSRLLLNLLQENRGLTGLELLTEIASSINHPDSSVVIDKGEKLLQDLRSKDVILGTRPA